MVTVPDVTANTAASGGWGGTISDIGWAASGAGLAMSTVGAYYAAEAQKGNLKQQALSLDFQAQQAALDASQAEKEAQSVLAAGATEKMSLTLQQGQQRASLIAGQGASGATLGGSNAEVRASQRLIQRLETMNLDANTINAANAVRARGVNALNASRLAQVSARNLRGTAGTIKPFAAAASAAFGSAGTIAAQWSYRERTTRRN